MKSSIRARLLFWMTAVMAILLLVFAVVVYEVLRQSLLEGFDKVLLASARTVSDAVERTESKIQFELDAHEAPEFYRSVDPDSFQLWLEHGESLAGSPSVNAGYLPRLSGMSETPVFQTVRLPDGRSGRAVGLVFTPKADDESGDAGPTEKVELVVARGTASLDSTIRFIRWLLTLGTCGTLVLTLLLGAVAVRRGLKPLDALAARIAAIRREDLSAQIPADWMPVEMVPVVGKLNDLLRHLDDAFRRERAFTADTAHELRTPLAGLRSTLEVALSKPRKESEYRETLAECLDVVHHTQRVVETLLALARFESGQTVLRPEAIHARELVETAWLPLCDEVASRGITVDMRLHEGMILMADRDACRMIVNALLSNAAEYTDNNGRIEISGRIASESVELAVVNTGCTLSEVDAPRVFDRFWRGDPARADTGIHCGLGLALARQAAIALGGSIDVGIAGGTFSVRLRLPASSGTTSGVLPHPKEISPIIHE